LFGIFPGLAVLSHADDDVQAIIPEIQALSVTLRAVADKGECVILEVVLEEVSYELQKTATSLMTIRHHNARVVLVWRDSPRASP
jgi:hypothetical protein